MNKLVQLILSLLVALVSEIVLRKLDDHAQADAAEGAVLASGTALAIEIIDSFQQLPNWLKEPMKNPIVLGRLLKMADDAAEKAILDAIKALEAQPEPVK